MNNLTKLLENVADGIGRRQFEGENEYYIRVDKAHDSLAELQRLFMGVQKEVVYWMEQA